MFRITVERKIIEQIVVCKLFTEFILHVVTFYFVGYES